MFPPPPPQFILNTVRSLVGTLTFVVLFSVMRIVAYFNWFPKATPFLKRQSIVWIDWSFFFKVRGCVLVEVSGSRRGVCTSVGAVTVTWWFVRQMLGMTMLNNQIPVNLIAIADKFVESSVVAVMCSAVPLYAFCIKLLMVPCRWIHRPWHGHAVHGVAVVFGRSCVLQGKGAEISIQGVLGLCAAIVGAVFIALPQMAGSTSRNPGLGIGIAAVGPFCLASAARTCAGGSRCMRVVQWRWHRVH